MKTLSLQETLDAIKRQHAVLLADGTLWPSGVSRPLKRGVQAHKEKLLAKLAHHDYDVCPASWYHWRYWNEEGQCEMCAQLAPEIARLDYKRQRRYDLMRTRQDEIEIALLV